MVKKRRKMRWIVSGVATALALFVLTVFLIDYNSTDAKIERAVAQIVEEYEFEPWNPTPGSSNHFYRSARMDAETTDGLVAKLQNSYSWGDYTKDVLDINNRRVTETGLDPWTEYYSFQTNELGGESLGGSITFVLFSPDDKGETPDIGRGSSLAVIKFDRPNLWERIKGMMPW